MYNEEPCLHFEAKLVPDLRTKIKKRLIADICDLKQSCKVKDNIRRRAETTEETTQQILATELGNVSEGVAANLPSIDTLRRNVRHSRQDRDLPPNRIRREDIPALPPAYSITTNEDPFLVLDGGVGDHERMFIFASPQGLQFLADSEHWYADGTFKV